MTKFEDNQSPYITFLESAAPGTPASTLGKLYVKTDGILYFKNDAGTETSLIAGAAGIPATIFDAKGDIIAATAADTASRLAVGTNGTVLVAASGEATGLKWAGPGGYETLLAAGDITIVNANTWYSTTELALTPPAGDYIAIGTLAMSSASALATHLIAKVSTGGSLASNVLTGDTTIRDAANYNAPGNAGGQVTNVVTCKVAGLDGATVVRVSGASTRGTSDSAIIETQLANGTANKASSLVLIRITSL